MTTHYTPDELIAHAKAYIAADAQRMARRPASYPKGAWRLANPIDLPLSFAVRDLALKTKPRRKLSFDLNGDPYDLWVWAFDSAGNGRVVERIHLRAPDAAERLARYAVVG